MFEKQNRNQLYRKRCDRYDLNQVIYSRVDTVEYEDFSLLIVSLRWYLAYFFTHFQGVYAFHTKKWILNTFLSFCFCMRATNFSLIGIQMPLTKNTVLLCFQSEIMTESIGFLFKNSVALGKRLFQSLLLHSSQKKITQEWFFYSSRRSLNRKMFPQKLTVSSLC